MKTHAKKEAGERRFQPVFRGRAIPSALPAESIKSQVSHEFHRMRVFPEAHFATGKEDRCAPTQPAAADEAADLDFQQAHLCVQVAESSGPMRATMSSRERARASFGLWNARGIVSRAVSNLARHDPYHLRLAARAFHQAVDFSTLETNLLSIRTILDNLRIGENLTAGTCNEPTCNGNSAAFTLDDLSGIVLCPFYFNLAPRTLVITLLHEAGHMASLDPNWAPGNEVYCRSDETVDCADVCPTTGQNLLENVDAWAQFTYCLAMSG